MTEANPPSLDSVLTKIMAPGAPFPQEGGSKLDPLALIVTMMQTQQAQMEARLQAEREERKREEERRREEKAESNKMMMSMAALIVPKLLDKPGMDPLMLKMLENSNNKEAIQQFMQMSSALNQQSMQMFMQQLTTMFGSMGEMQNRMTERQMELMEERLEKMNDKDDEKEQHPLADIIKAALPHVLGNKAPVAQAVVDAASASAAPAPAANPEPAARIAPPDTATMPPDLARKVRILHLAAWLQSRPVTHPKRGAFEAKLVELVAQADDVARAILADDSAALFGALGGAVEADPMMRQWIAAPAAQAWLAPYVADVLRPALVRLGETLRAQAQRTDADIPARPVVATRVDDAPSDGAAGN